MIMSQYVHGVSKKKVLAAYRFYRSSREVAEALRLSHTSVIRTVRELGAGSELKPRGREKVQMYSERSGRKSSKFGKWLEAHKDEPMPRDFKEIARISDCSYSAVTSYFYRERKALKQYLGNLPDLRKHNVALRDIEGDVYETQDFDSYSFRVDRFTLNVVIIAKTQGQKLIFAIPDPGKLERAVNQTAKNVGPAESESTSRQETPSSSHPTAHIHAPQADHEPGAQQEPDSESANSLEHTENTES